MSMEPNFGYAFLKQTDTDDNMEIIDIKSKYSNSNLSKGDVVKVIKGTTVTKFSLDGEMISVFDESDIIAKIINEKPSELLTEDL